MQISGNEPDVILINEVIPKAQQIPLTAARIAIPNYVNFNNFDPDKPNLGLLGKRGISIYAKSDLQATEITVNNHEFEEQLWIKIQLKGQDSLLMGCIYRSPSANGDASTSKLCDMLKEIVESKPSHLVVVGEATLSLL